MNEYTDRAEQIKEQVLNNHKDSVLEFTTEEMRREYREKAEMLLTGVLTMVVAKRLDDARELAFQALVACYWLGRGDGSV